MREIVLPCGAFAAMRPPTMADLIFAQADNSWVFLTRLASRLVTLDGEPMTIAEFEAMEVANFLPISTMLNQQISDATQYRNGVA